MSVRHVQPQPGRRNRLRLRQYFVYQIGVAPVRAGGAAEHDCSNGGVDPEWLAVELSCEAGADCAVVAGVRALLSVGSVGTDIEVSARGSDLMHAAHDEREARRATASSHQPKYFACPGEERQTSQLPRCAIAHRADDAPQAARGRGASGLFDRHGASPHRIRPVAREPARTNFAGQVE